VGRTQPQTDTKYNEFHGGARCHTYNSIFLFVHFPICSRLDPSRRSTTRSTRHWSPHSPLVYLSAPAARIAEAGGGGGERRKSLPIGIYFKKYIARGPQRVSWGGGKDRVHTEAQCCAQGHADTPTKIPGSTVQKDTGSCPIRLLLRRPGHPLSLYTDIRCRSFSKCRCYP
jgi:hypothetical protein